MESVSPELRRVILFFAGAGNNSRKINVKQKEILADIDNTLQNTNIKCTQNCLSAVINCDCA